MASPDASRIEPAGAAMNAERLLSHLDRVRQVAPGRWVASCPAHEDRTPSLSIREIDDGRILLHDFGGCDSGDVLAAVGLSLSDLFPEKLTRCGKPGKLNHWHAAREALNVLANEALLIVFGAEDIAAGREICAEDRERIVLAAARIRAAARVCQ